MKLFGVFLIIASSSYMGFHLTVLLQKKIQLLHELQQCLKIMKNEIAFCGTPLPKLFHLLAAHTHGDLYCFFRKISEKMDLSSTTTPAFALEAVLQNTNLQWLDPELKPLFNQLGSYDLDAQLSAISQAQSHLTECLTQLEHERRQKGKVYESLGICAGLALAILFV